MNEEWKIAIKKVNPEILNQLYKIACEQNDCSNTGDNVGKCAYCADMAECIVGHYLIFTGAYK